MPAFPSFLLLATVTVVFSVDRSKFRTCGDTGFCRRYRGIAGPPSGKNYELDTSSVREHSGLISAKLRDGETKALNLNIAVNNGGSVRITISEDEKRWQPLDLLMPEGLQPGSYSILKAGDNQLPTVVKQLPAAHAFLAVAFGSETEKETLVVHATPLKFELYHGDLLQITANDRFLMHYEKKQGAVETADVQAQVSDVDRHGGKTVVDYGEDGLATYSDGSREERKATTETVATTRGGDSFGGHTDTQPHGPMSVGIDFAFPFAKHVYGIPQHTSPLSLPTSAQGSAGIAPHYSQPYRLYNLDVFEYELDQTMALYGHIPLMVAHGIAPGGKGKSAGVFWFNPSETFIDISDGGSSSQPFKESHWISESGEIDFFFIPGPTPADVFSKFTRLTGRQQLPPLFALGYHQCRWNYRDERDVATVEGMFESLDYPMDVLWLDIEHTDGKRYFTWDKSVFPNPIEMQKNVSAHGRRMVTIVDPHIKRDNNFHVHSEATSKGLYIKNKDGSDFDGWCWPGSSSYLDFTSPKVRQWWAERFALDKYVGSTMDLFTWNDMNEPSVFNGPEVSMPKDNKNLEGIDHREWHNLYGLYMQSATADGLVLRAGARDPTQKPRPFVLSRAFWAGSQRFGAIWTGDNTAEWGHLRIAAPMLLSINLAGLSFAGADVGGFFGEPGAELFTRWYQAGAFTPFFRGHAHHDTKRREPWVFGEPYTTILRGVALVRYSLLPLWYTVFYQAYTEGVPVMRTIFTEFPDDEATFAMDDQWMVGSALLVKPVTSSGVDRANVYLPGGEAWYDLFSLKAVAPSANGYASVPAPLESIPVFIRPGSVIPRKMRLRRSSKLMFFDPYTLVVAPNAAGQAAGELYLDDETSFAHEATSAYAYRAFTFDASKGTLACSVKNEAGGRQSSGAYRPINTVERIELAGQQAAPKRVVLSSDADPAKELVFFYDAASKVVTVKKPDAKVAEDWVITFEF